MTQSTPQAVLDDLKIKQIFRIVESRKLRASLDTIGRKIVAQISSTHHEQCTNREKTTAEQTLEKSLHALEPKAIAKLSFFGKMVRMFSSFFK